MQREASDRYQRGWPSRRRTCFKPVIRDCQQATQDFRDVPRAYLQMALCHKAVDYRNDALVALRLAAVSPVLSTDECGHVLHKEHGSWKNW